MLRFLIASRQEVAASQLRDDLLSMLVAGHETTGSVLTWTLHLLATHPEQMANVRALLMQNSFRLSGKAVVVSVLGGFSLARCLLCAVTG